MNNHISVAELRQSGYALANTFKESKKVIDIVNYIDFLAMNNSFPADTMKLPFAEKDGKCLEVTKADINALFFSFMEGTKEEERKKVKPISDEDRSLILKNTKGRREAEITRKIGEIETSKRAAADHFRAGNERLMLAKKQQDEIDLFSVDAEKHASKWLEDVDKALRETNWDFHAYDPASHILLFVNRADTILRFVNNNAGMKYDLNCGKYILKINAINMEIRVNGFQNVAEINGYIHPHCPANSRPCWGNAEGTIIRAVSTADVATVIRVIDSLLQNYNPDSPYVKIDDYKRAIEARDKSLRERFEREQKAKEAGKGPSKAMATIIDEEELFEDDGWIEDTGGDSDE